MSFLPLSPAFRIFSASPCIPVVCGSENEVGPDPLEDDTYDITNRKLEVSAHVSRSLSLACARFWLADCELAGPLQVERDRSERERNSLRGLSTP